MLFYFFVLAGYAALYLNHLKDLFGKIIAPILLILMGILFLGTIFVVPFSLSPATDSYANNAFVTGFIEG